MVGVTYGGKHQQYLTATADDGDSGIWNDWHDGGLSAMALLTVGCHDDVTGG